MQTFSSMRRNSTDKKNLTIFFIVIGIVVYVSISDIFYLLPPLFGVAYVLTQEKYESGDFGAFYFLVPFFLYQNRAGKKMYLFGTVASRRTA